MKKPIIIFFFLTVALGISYTFLRPHKNKSSLDFIHENFTPISVNDQKKTSSQTQLNIPLTCLPTEWEKSKGNLLEIISQTHSQIFIKNFKIKGKEHTLIVLPENNEAFLYSQEIFIPVTLKSDYTISKETIPLDLISSQINPDFESYLKAIQTGIPPLKAMTDFIFGPHNLKEQLDQIFVSEKGKKLKNII